MLDGVGTGRLRMGAVATPAPAKLENEDMREKLLGVVLGIDWALSREAVSGCCCVERDGTGTGEAGSGRRVAENSAR